MLQVKCHYLVEWLPSCTWDVLHYDVAADEVRANPGRIEGGTRSIQEHNTNHVIAYVALLVHL